jgi:hypothetical protein
MLGEPKASFYRKVKEDEELRRIIQKLRTSFTGHPPQGFRAKGGDIEAVEDEPDESE